MVNINIQLLKVKTNSSEVIPCPQCGSLVSIYFFSLIKLPDGTVVYPQCQNCGHFDDPE